MYLTVYFNPLKPRTLVKELGVYVTVDGLEMSIMNIVHC